MKALYNLLNIRVKWKTYDNYVPNQHYW
jgi:hypothetical protein